MSLQPLENRRFVRKTQLGQNEYRKNFHQIDREVMAAVTSAEADQVTPLMSKIYLRMVNAPEKFWEREGVLRIESEVRDEKIVKAWAVFCDLVSVASATASKAIRWMHEQGIIGYFSGKNGVGLRIFLNRAASSIGVRQGQACKKILAFHPASSGESPASLNEPAFMDSYAVREVSDTDINPGAPKDGAEKGRGDKPFSELTPAIPINHYSTTTPAITHRRKLDSFLLENVITRMRAELGPVMHTAAQQVAVREHERTREWFITHALPKAIRVSQRSAYDVLRSHGVVTDPRGGKKNSGLEVGRHVPSSSSGEPLTDDDVISLAQSCVALLETQGQSFERTLAEMSVEGGGFLLPQDAPRVRAKVEDLIRGGK